MMLPVLSSESNVYCHMQNAAVSMYIWSTAVNMILVILLSLETSYICEYTLDDSKYLYVMVCK